jgi:hypothetical protein
MKNLDVHKDLEISAHDIRRLQEQGRITIDILQVGSFFRHSSITLGVVDMWCPR